MKKKHVILYLTDNAIYMKNNNNIIKYKAIKETIVDGKIANIKKFTKLYNSFIKENNLNTSIFGDTIKVIIDNSWTNVDIEVLNNILLSFNYRKVIFEYDTSYYKLKDNNVYISIWDNYLIINYLDEYHRYKTILINSSIFNNIKDKMDYIANIVGNKELYLLGYGEELQNIFNVFEDTYNINTYIFSNNETYLLDTA